MRWIATVLSVLVASSAIMAAPPQLAAQSATQNAAARTLFIEGRDLWDDGKFEDAEKKFREALTKYPKADQSDRTAYYLITTLIKLGRTADARAEIDNFNKNYPQSTWTSDVEEKRLTLTGLRVVRNGQAQVFLNLPTPFSPDLTVRPGDVIPSLRFDFNGSSVTAFGNASLEQEILRLILEKDADRGIEIAKERLKANPSDPAVIANLSTIANSSSPQALPFLVMIAGNAASSPNTRSQALFWMGRRNNDRDAVAKALMDMMKDKDASTVVADALARFNAADRRSTLEQIAQSQNSDRMAMLERLYKISANAQLRSQIVQAVGTTTDPAALAFLTDAARNEKEPAVRRAAIQALAGKKDVDVKTLEDILKGLPPTPAKQ